MQPRQTKPKTAVKAAVLPATEPLAIDPASRDLVGWALGTDLGRGRRLSPGITRDVLATALGLDSAALAGLDSAQLRTALARLRALAAHAEQLAELAATDDLTGALRRRAGLAALQREIDRASRVGGKGIVVAFLDVVGLKRVNDSAGHAAGDQLLTELVASIFERVRSYDLVIRYGGDEFVCALIDEALPDATRTIADIQRQFEARSRGRTFSVGVAELVAGDTAASVVARADAALYVGRRKARH